MVNKTFQVRLIIMKDEKRDTLTQYPKRLERILPIFSDNQPEDKVD